MTYDANKACWCKPSICWHDVSTFKSLNSTIKFPLPHPHLFPSHYHINLTKNSHISLKLFISLFRTSPPSLSCYLPTRRWHLRFLTKIGPRGCGTWWPGLYPTTGFPIRYVRRDSSLLCLYTENDSQHQFHKGQQHITRARNPKTMFITR